MAFAHCCQQPLSRTFRGERGKPVAQWKRLSLALACVGNVFAHRLFTHFIRPPEEEERNTGRKMEGREEKGGKRTGKEKCGLKHGDIWRVCRGTGGLGPSHLSHSFTALSRIFRGFFWKFRCPHSKLMQVVIYKHQRVFPLVPKSDKHRPTCHEEKTKMSCRNLSRSNFTFAFRKIAVGQLLDQNDLLSFFLWLIWKLVVYQN